MIHLCRIVTKNIQLNLKCFPSALKFCLNLDGTLNCVTNNKTKTMVFLYYTVYEYVSLNNYRGSFLSKTDKYRLSYAGPLFYFRGESNIMSLYLF